MRVLHVQKVKGIGGSERHLLALLPALSAAGVSIRMCVLGAEQSEPQFAAPLRELGVDTVSIPAGPHVHPLLFGALAREVLRFRPNVVHTHLFHADLYGQPVARATRVPGVSSAHGTSDFFRREPYRSIARLTHGLASRTIAISHYVRRFLEELRLDDPEAIRVVHYGIDLSGWQLSPERRAEARAAHQVGPDEVAVGIASRLVRGKGHDLLIDAFALARERAPNLRLLVAGDGALRARLEERASRLGPSAVSFLGFVADIPRFMATCDVFTFPTLPSFGEGFGLAALEAMAAGRPVIATRLGPLPEVVGEEGAGFLVSHRDPGPLAEAITALATDPELRERMGREALARARRLFALEAMVERTLAVYREVA